MNSKRAKTIFEWSLLGLIVTLCILSLDSMYFDPSHKKFIFILGIWGVWRYGNAVIHFTRGLYFLYWHFPKLRKKIDALGDDALPSEIFLVVTSFRIPIDTTYSVYRSVFEEALRVNCKVTIVVSIVEKADELLIKSTFQDIILGDKDIKLIIVRARGTGKRDGLAHAFRAISRHSPNPDAIVGVIDGDTEMLPHCVYNAVSVFSLLPSVGGVTTDEYCEVVGGRLEKEWHTMRFAQRHINMSSMSLSNRVLTMTGRLSFFRAPVLTDPEFIKDVEADFLNHWRLGTFRFLTGDDKSSWLSLMRMGWETYYVPDSKTLTIEHPPDKNFFRATRQLMFRWYGNSLRQNFRATKILGFRRLGLFATYVLYDQRVAMWTCLIGLFSSLIIGLFYDFTFLWFYVAWILLSRSIISLLLKLSGHPISPMYPFTMYYNQIVGSIMKIKVMFHLDQQKWTRQKTTLSSTKSSLDEKLNKYTSRMMWFGSLMFFMAFVGLVIDLSFNNTIL